MAEPPGAPRHRRPVLGLGGSVPGSQSEHAVPEPARDLRGRQRQRGDRLGVEQLHLAQLAVPAGEAGRALLDVPADPLAERHGQPPVPAGQQLVQLRAVLASGAGHEQHPERRLELVMGTGKQHVLAVAGYPEHVRGLRALWPLLELKGEDLLLAAGQSADRRADQRAQPGVLGVHVQACRGAGHIRRRRRCRFPF
jgi:hypothetical protein